MPASQTNDWPWQRANPWISGLLAFLIPGAGHFYQRRHFKAVLYMVCILGTFVYGTSLAEWKACTYTQQPGRRNWGYLAQIGVGLPAILAYVQSERFDAESNHVRRALQRPLTDDFTGVAVLESEDDEDDPQQRLVSGRIELRPAMGPLGPEVEGRFQGEDEDGDPVEFELGGQIRLGPPVFNDRERSLVVEILGEGGVPVGLLEGDSRKGHGVSRSLVNHVFVPLEPAQIQALHHRLGRYYELALVYTWIAGLLNVLAIWDAVEGPAYGIGDEPDESSDEAHRPGEKAKTTPEDGPPEEGSGTPDEQASRPTPAT